MYQRSRPSPLYLDALSNLDDSATIYIATGTIQKFKDIKNIIEAQAIPAHVAPIFQLVDNFQNAPEDTFSYSGNLNQKLDEAFLAWNAMSPDEQKERLHALGLNPRKVFILAEDSGFHFADPTLMFEPEIYGRLNDKLKARLHEGMLGPGPEAAPVITACGGNAQFFHLLEVIETRRGEPIDRSVIADSYMGIVPLLHPTWRIVGQGRIDNEFITSARPPSGAVQIENYLVPKSADLANQLTEAELEHSGVNFKRHYSAKADAWNTLSRKLGFEGKWRPASSRQSKHEFVTGIVTDDSNAQTITLEERREAKLLSTSIDTLEDVETKIFDEADGLIFCFDPDPQAIEKNFFRNMFIFTSALVGHQTHDRHVMAKPIVLVNPNGEFDYIEEMIWDMHRIGAVPENPNDLFRSFKTIAEAKAYLEDCAPDYYYMPPAREKTYSVGESHPEKGVAVFCSATSENASVCGKAKSFVQFLGGAGINLVSGLGMNGTMGALTHTAAEKGVHHTGFSVGHIMNRPQGEGHGEHLANYFGLCKNIYTRIESFFKHSNLLIMFFGGLGTIQEMAAFCWQKQRLLENPEDRYAKMVAGTEGIIWNESYKHLGKTISCFGRFIAAAPAGLLMKLGVHITGSQEETEKKALEVRGRQKAGAAPRNWLAGMPRAPIATAYPRPFPLG